MSETSSTGNSQMPEREESPGVHRKSEGGGRATQAFLRQLAKFKARPVLQRRMAWRVRYPLVCRFACLHVFAWCRMRWSVTTVSLGWSELDSFVGHFLLTDVSSQFACKKESTPTTIELGRRGSGGSPCSRAVAPVFSLSL